MVGWSSRRLTGVAVVAVLASGCVDERAFYISEIRSPCLTGMVSNGLLDVAGKEGYRISAIIMNDLLSSTGTDQQPERSRLAVRKFMIKIDLGQAGAANAPSELTDFEIPVSGTITPGGTAEIGYFPVVPAALVAYLNFPSGHRPMIVATIQVEAEQNGSTVESAEYSFPIELCSGCLVRDVGGCPTEDDTYTTNSCGLPQDEPVTCCTDSVAGFHCLKQ
mgnify:CR=1 FL=1